MHERILMAVDDSPASEKALEYVTRMVTGRPDHYVHLVHVLPPVASGSMGGAELEEAAQHDKARELLSRMSERLGQAGLGEGHVDSGYLAVRSDTSMVEGLLDTARDQSCSTIVVGRSALPRVRELFHSHPADELVRKAQGFTLWIVE